MKTIQLNIGLNTNTGSTVSPSHVQCVLAESGLLTSQLRLAQSGTELTYCATVLVEEPLMGISLEGTLFDIAGVLDQDCIAWIDESGTGHLTGPQAAKWGAFDPAQFLPVIENPVGAVRAALRQILTANGWKPGSKAAIAAEYALTIGAEVTHGPVPYFQICRMSGRSIL